MRTAVLAWGSLIWDCRELVIAEDFKQCGPHLPVEFCRVSGDGRLTLAIDETFGASCSTYSAASAAGDLDAAIENLRLREGMPGAKGVGFVEVASGRHSDRAMERHPQAVARIKAWAQANGFDAAIWTALASGENQTEESVPNGRKLGNWGRGRGPIRLIFTTSIFHELDKAAEPFSVDAAIRYLKTRDDATRRTALRYIRKAPQEVQTPVRAAVTQHWPEG